MSKQAIAIYAFVATALLLLLPTCLSFKHIAQARVSQIRESISATSRGSTNITVAYEACELWKTVVADTSDLSEDILSTCLVLYASCLVRTGRDDQADILYSKALELEGAMSKESLDEAVLGRGRALQRLLLYEKARDQFLQLESSEPAICGAAACSLRIGKAKEAVKLLSRFLDKEADPKMTRKASAMLGSIHVATLSTSRYQDSLRRISRAAASSLLYRWILSIANKRAQSEPDPLPKRKRDYRIFDLAEINISPFDDHNLLILDDKVYLHQLLSSNIISKDFWPFGIVSISEMASQNTTFEQSDLWIHKQRSGYGSHGNRVLNSQEAKEIATTLDEASLLQRMVAPCMMVESRKFSLRIYAIYFPPIDSTSQSDVYVSKEGLVKLASVPFISSDTLDMRMHMTNSGREHVMRQESLDILKELFYTRQWSYDEFWQQIQHAVHSTIEIYESIPRTASNFRRLGVPKILGFDFVVDENRNAWLLEVNRFPGLIGRDDCDRAVKESLLASMYHATPSL